MSNFILTTNLPSINEDHNKTKAFCRSLFKNVSVGVSPSKIYQRWHPMHAPLQYDEDGDRIIPSVSNHTRKLLPTASRRTASQRTAMLMLMSCLYQRINAVWSWLHECGGSASTFTAGQSIEAETDISHHEH